MLFRAILKAGIPLRVELLKRATTLEDLAALARLPPKALRATVDRFNSGARQGVDEEFGRGAAAYDRMYGDPRVKPNPTLAPIQKPPFYAFPIYAGDIGTCGGLVTDEHARVLNEARRPIEGLYAVGNNAASVMGGSYPGAGSTLGPSMTFAYIAALHLTSGGRSTAAGATERPASNVSSSPVA